MMLKQMVLRLSYEKYLVVWRVGKYHPILKSSLGYYRD